MIIACRTVRQFEPEPLLAKLKCPRLMRRTAPAPGIEVVETVDWENP
jgi:hypothetical protein